MRGQRRERLCIWRAGGKLGGAGDGIADKLRAEGGVVPFRRRTEGIPGGAQQREVVWAGQKGRGQVGG